MTITHQDSMDDLKYLRILQEKSRTLPFSQIANNELQEYTEASQEKRKLIRETVKRKSKDKEMGIKIKKLEAKQKNIIYYSVTNNTIKLWTDNNTKEVLFSGNPSVYIQRIITKKNVELNDLIKIGSSDKKSNISGTISRINKRLRSRFILSEDIIKNDRNGSGYYINRIYSLLQKNSSYT